MHRNDGWSTSIYTGLLLHISVVVAHGAYSSSRANRGRFESCMRNVYNNKRIDESLFIRFT